MKVEDMEDQGNLLVINIPKTKTYVRRKFTMEGMFRAYVKKYSARRPTDMSKGRFFLNYQKGKCTHQFMGKHKIGSVPKLVAEFLKLPNSDRYTGHALRRTSTSILADEGLLLLFF